MPKAGYIPKHKLNIGKGGHMDPDTLKRALLKAINKTPAMLEKEGFKHGTATRLCRKINELELTVEKLGSMTSKELHALYYKRARPEQSHNKIMPDIDLLQDKYVKSRLEAKTPSQKKLALTMKTTIELYYFGDPENIKLVESGQHSFFSESRVIQMWKSRLGAIKSPVYIKEHLDGGEAEYDFTGVKLPYVADGVTRYATFIVAVLSGSRYIFAKAIENQSQAVVCDAIADSFRYFGGCPKVIRIDNFKAAVKEAARYEGQLTDDMINFKEFFGIDIFTCRSYRPKDKGIAEAAVKYVTGYALSIANNFVKEGHTFTSLNEINSFIEPYLLKINQKRVKGLKSSREELFHKEKSLLRQPPSWDYRHFQSFIIKVPVTARYSYQEHQYALPSRWIGENITVHLTTDSVTFLNIDTPIVSYKRKDNVKGLSVNPGLVPENHIIYDIFAIKNQDQMLLSWADVIGKDVKEWCETKLTHSNYPYADKVRLVHKFLTIVKANKAHYKLFNKCVKENMYSTLNGLTPSNMKKIWDKQEKPAAYEHDDDYNGDAYITVGQSFLAGTYDSMSWPISYNKAVDIDPISKIIKKPSKEYLNGQSVYSKRFAYIKKAIGS